jgi:hypothetical protein
VRQEKGRTVAATTTHRPSGWIIFAGIIAIIAGMYNLLAGLDGIGWYFQ